MRVVLGVVVEDLVVLVREGQRRAEDVVAEVEARELLRVAEDLVGVLGRAEARGRGLDGPRVRDAALAQLVRVELEREPLVLGFRRDAVDAVRRSGDGEAQRSAVARLSGRRGQKNVRKSPKNHWRWLL